MKKKLSMKDLKGTIQCIHKLWYQEDFGGKESWLDSPEDMLKMHRHMEILFNFADITETTVENNPDLVSPEQFKKMCGIKEDSK